MYDMYKLIDLAIYLLAVLGLGLYQRYKIKILEDKISAQDSMFDKMKSFFDFVQPDKFKELAQIETEIEIKKREQDFQCEKEKLMKDLTKARDEIEKIKSTIDTKDEDHSLVIDDDNDGTVFDMKGLWALIIVLQSVSVMHRNIIHRLQSLIMYSIADLANDNKNNISLFREMLKCFEVYEILTNLHDNFQKMMDEVDYESITDDGVRVSGNLNSIYLDDAKLFRDKLDTLDDSIKKVIDAIPNRLL